MSYILKYTNACLNSNEEANTNVQWEELLYKNAITSDRQLRPGSLHQDNKKKGANTTIPLFFVAINCIKLLNAGHRKEL